MVSEGHLNAETYALGKVWEENQLVTARNAKKFAMMATMMQRSMATVAASFGKKGQQANKDFAELIKELNGDGG